MKKKFFLLILIILNFSLILKVNAEDAVAQCKYYTADKEEYIIVTITEDYQVNLTSPYFKIGEVNTVKYSVTNHLEYDNYKNSNSNISCEETKIIYSYIVFSYDGDSRKGTSVNHITKSINGDESYLKKYSLSVEESKVENPDYDSPQDTETHWLQVCHYGSFYLKFNKSEYETNISRLIEKPGFNVKLLNVMEYLNSNQYSCPTSLCVSDKNYYFSQEYNSNCIISINYMSTYKCGSLAKYIKEYETLQQENSINSEEGKKLIENTLKFCDAAFSNLNFSDSNNCVKECLQITKKFKTDLNIYPIGDGQCGLSSQIILYIANIIKWVKYILPVIVIVLGIVDFIKAIAADKDDEMKKAQNRFIKRLIAAALIFIVPFIIEFVLGIFGFNSNGCGIIDL